MPPCSCLHLIFLLIPHHTIPPVGLDVEGLYRVSGKTNDILRIKKQFDNGKPSLLGCTKSVEGSLSVPTVATHSHVFSSCDICCWIECRSTPWPYLGKWLPYRLLLSYSCVAIVCWATRVYCFSCSNWLVLNPQTTWASEVYFMVLLIFQCMIRFLQKMPGNSSPYIQMIVMLLWWWFHSLTVSGWRVY